MRAVRLGRPCHVVLQEDGLWACVAGMVVRAADGDGRLVVATFPYRGGLGLHKRVAEDHGPGDERGQVTAHWLEKCPGKDLKVAQ